MKLSLKAILLLDKVYPEDRWVERITDLLKWRLEMKAKQKAWENRFPHGKNHVITDRNRIPAETQCCGGEDFDRFQTRYHGIPEHLIEANDHD